MSADARSTLREAARALAGLAGLCATTAALVACAGRAPAEAPSAQSSQSRQSEKATSDARSEVGASESSAPAGAAPTPAPRAPEIAPGGAELGARRDAFVRASVLLEQAGADCVAACRALGAMDRSAGELCTIDDVSGHERVCTDAVSRVRAARDRVRGVCLACPDGVSLDRHAPVPSPR